MRYTMPNKSVQTQVGQLIKPVVHGWRYIVHDESQPQEGDIGIQYLHMPLVHKLVA